MEKNNCCVGDLTEEQCSSNICFLFELINMLENYNTKYSFINVDKMSVKFDVYCDIIINQVKQLKSIKNEIFLKKLRYGGIKYE